MTYERLHLSLLLCAVFFMTGCSSLIYYPDRNMYVDKKTLTPEPEEIHLDVDQWHVHGWYFKSNKPGKVCVSYFHGNAQNRSAHYIHLYWMVKHGIDYYIWDYPGYGDVKGEPTPENTVKSAMGALLHVNSKNCEKHIVYGHSLGGQIAMRAVSELRDEFTPDLFVIDSTFLSYQEVANLVLRKSWLTWLIAPLSYVVLSDKWAMEERRVRDLASINKIFIHTKTDQVVPYELGERAHELATGQKEFWIKEQGDHNNIYYDPKGLKLRKLLLERIENLSKK